MKGNINTPIIMWTVIGLGLAWLLIAGWYTFGPEPASSSYSVGYYQAPGGTGANCRGKYSKLSYSERYRCTMENQLAMDRETAARWTFRLAIVFGPPFLLAFAYNKARAKEKRLAEAAALRRRRQQAAAATQAAPKPGSDLDDAGSASPA